MAITRINNNQITDAIAGNLYVGINAAAKLQNYSITSQKISNNLTYGSDLTISGNLTVQGNVTAIDTIDLVVEDPLILLAKDQTGSPSLDIGFIGERGSEINIAFIWDEGAGEFATVYTNDAITNTVVTIDSYASLHVANITASNADITGNVTFSGNIVGDLTVSGNVDAGNLNSSAAVTGVTITASGNLEGNNATITNAVSSATVTASGNILGGNVNSNAAVTGVTITASGNLEGNNATITNAITTSTLDASGNIVGGNVNSNAAVTGVTITASGNLEGNNATITNAITAATLDASGNIVGGNVNSNAAVTGVTITASGNLEGNNATITNAITAATLDASGNVLAGNLNANTNVTGLTITASGNLEGNNAVITNGVSSTTVNATGNVQAGNVNSDNIVSAVTVNATTVEASGNLAGGNANISNGVYALTGTFGGNVSANYFFGNGSQLTGIDATQISSGNSNIKISTANGNATVNIGGTANVAVFSTNSVDVTGAVNATGNVTAGNITSNAAVTGVTVTASGNLVGGNANITAGVYAATVTASGNVNGGNINTNSIVGTDITVTGANVNFVLSGNLDMGQRWINDLADPVQAFDAATKQYVDDQVSAGLTIHTPVYLESPTALAATYAQGGTVLTVTDTVAGNVVVFSTAANLQPNDQLWFSTSFEGIVANVAYFVVSAPNTSAAVLSTAYNGVPVGNITGNTGLSQSVRVNSGIGATLTNSGANAALVVDGVTVTGGERILVYTQASAAQNGVYTVTVPGDAGNAWVLTRSSDTNTYGPKSTNQLDAGDYFFVQAGNTAAGESYVLTEPTGVIIIGYTPVTFTQFSASSTYSAGNGLSLNGTVFSVNVDDVTTAIVADAVVVKAGANLTTPNIGDATGNSLTLGGNGLLSATTVSVTGNVSGANINATTGVYTVAVDASGNIVGGNLNSNAAVTGVTITASGNLNGGNAVVTGDVSAATGTFSGNVDGSNINATTAVNAATVTASGNLVGGNANITSGVYAATVTASGNVLAGNLNSNAAVTGVTVTASGNLNGGNAVVTGDVSAATGTFGGNVSAGNVAVTGNVDGVGGYFTGNITAANFIGNISGNISGNVNAGGSNTQIQFNDETLLGGSAAFTFDKTSNAVTLSGNLDAGNINTGIVSVTGQIVSTSAGSATTGAGQIYLNGSGNNRIDFNTNGVAAPTYTTRSNGVKVLLYPSISGSAADYALGVEAGALWSGIPGNDAGQFFKWYGGDTQIANLSGTGVFYTAGNITGANFITGGLVDATGNINGGNVISSGLVDATGNITGGNIATAGQADLGNIVISGDTITGINGQVLVNSAGDDVNFIVSGDNIANLLVVDAGSDTVLIGTGTPTTNAALKIGTTNSILIPVGNTAQRPGTAVTGMVRFNTSLDVLEFYDSNSWTPASSEFTVITADEFNGDGSTVAFTLSADSTTAGTVVAINGVVQIPTTAYSVSGTTLTFTEAPETNDVIDARIFTTTTTVTSLSNAGLTAVVETLSTPDVEITGNLIPAANVTYDLGSTTRFWNDLYLAGNSIYLGTIVIKDVGANQIGFFQADGTTPATIDADNVDTTQIASGTSSVSVVSTNGNIRANVAGVTVQTISPGLVAITGDLSVSGNATLSGNILGDRVQNGTTSFDIQTPNGDANITVGGTSNVAVFTTAGANIAGTLGVTGNISGGNLSVSTGIITAGSIVNANANGVGNIGSATTYFNTVFAKATSAQYADLAEMYEADQIIEPGTVVCFGGAKEVTMCADDACRRVAGVVSTNPSYLMNSGQTGDHVVAVALQGRVPVKVTGQVRKGDMMVATTNGRARAEANPQVGAVIGKALADFDGQDGVIEVVIGRV